MNTLHIAPDDSAGGDLRAAIRSAGRDDQVLAFLDYLSCGPIDSDEPTHRAAWWSQFHSRGLDAEARLRQFRDRVASTDVRIVVWFSRHSARELSFFLAWTDRLGDRPYDTVDVTDRRLSLTRYDGTRVSASLRSVSIIPAYALRSLLGTERPITPEERGRSRRHWQRLRRENAPFRIVVGRQAKLDRRRQAKLYHLDLRGGACHERIS